MASSFPEVFEKISLFFGETALLRLSSTQASRDLTFAFFNSSEHKNCHLYEIKPLGLCRKQVFDYASHWCK